MLSYEDWKAAENKKRRERIATAILPRIYSGAGFISEKYAAELAIKYADALIAELDKT